MQNELDRCIDRDCMTKKQKFPLTYIVNPKSEFSDISSKQSKFAEVPARCNRIHYVVFFLPYFSEYRQKIISQFTLL